MKLSLLSFRAAGVLIFLILYPFEITYSSFSDVSENHKNYFAIEELRKINVLQGYSDFTFKPDQKITRAEALALVLKIHQGGQVGNYSLENIKSIQEYKDIAQDAWFYPYVQKATELSIVNGYSDLTFHPFDAVKLAEALKMAIISMKIDVSAFSKTAGEWYSKYLAYALEKKIIENSVKPDYSMNRGEFAEILFRLKYVKENRGAPFDVTIEWKVFSHPDNFFEIKYPREYAAFRGTRNHAVWREDKENMQAWMTRVTKGSARVSISFIEDASLSGANAWFSKIKQVQQNLYGNFVKFRETRLSGKQALFAENQVRKIHDLYIFLEAGKGLVFYGEYGSPELKEEVVLIEQSYKFIRPAPPQEPELTPEQKLEKARENLLIEGMGYEILKLFKDRRLIETDAIGVGTGPVDYFYSQEVNNTLKYERNSKTLLDIKEGRTTAF